MMITPIVGTIWVPMPTNAWVAASRNVFRLMTDGIGPPRATLDRTGMYEISNIVDHVRPDTATGCGRAARRTLARQRAGWLARPADRGGSIVHRAPRASGDRRLTPVLYSRYWTGPHDSERGAH